MKEQSKNSSRESEENEENFCWNVMRITRHFKGERPNFKLQFRPYFKLHETEKYNLFFD